MNSASPDRVTLTRAEYEALLERLEEAEDAAAIGRLETRIAEFGYEEATKDYVPGELVARLVAGEHPIRVWRKHRGLSRAQLAERAGVADGYIGEIEARSKPGSLDAMRKLCNALGVSLDLVAAWLAPHE